MTSVLSHPGAVGDRVARPRRYLMCRPDHFAVTYAINPWMRPDLPVDTARAVRLAADLADHGFVPVPVDLSELLLGGGGPKCCTLEVRP